MLACTNSHLAIIEMLLKNEVDINKENEAGMIPLHAACLSGNTKTVDMLLDKNADFTKKDRVNKYFLIIIEKLYSSSLCSDQRLSQANKAYLNRATFLDSPKEILL
jgi:ankyrin repeat protein